MPSIVTHHLFSEEVKNSTKKEIYEALCKSNALYHLFAQSFDNLFYYNFLSLKKGKQTRELGITAQQEKTNEYFKNIILSIKDRKLEKNEDALAYLYGSLTHYILDSNCHPFVIYYSGFIDKEHLNYEYRGLHEKMEVTIDSIYWKEKKGQDLYKASLADLLLPKIHFNKNLKELIDEVFFKTFQIQNMGNIYEKSSHQGHTILKYFVTDHFGLKKKLYKIYDWLFKRNLRTYQDLSFYLMHPNYEVLNRDHKIWYHPADNTLQSTESFDDLYHKALKEALDIFELTNKVLTNQISLETYLKHLGNKSYTTGMDWNQKAELKYFKKNTNK